MWYEILPTFMIITVAMAFPTFFAYPLNWVVVGNMYRRQMLSKEEALQYLRDKRLAGPYTVLGLDNIPDEEEEKEKEKRQRTEYSDFCSDE